ncbi:MAG: lysophospholipase [Bacilli bacterium]|nr:lysophospholipase [Bacilli bacterium]
MKKEITYKSLDGITEIHAVIWEPSIPITAILQISHGMIEHIRRYEQFANELNKHGILVCGNDHLGHGYSIVDKDHYGYFAEKNADSILVDDLHTLTTQIKNDYPNIPYFLLGHSMGSFIARNYLAKYGNELTGALIVGTGYHSNFEMTGAKILTSIIQFYKRGWFYRSKYIENKTNGGYYKHFENNSNHNCWLTNDKNVILEYENDPKNQFRFTCNGYYTVFTLIKSANKNFKNIDKNLPIILLAGKDDPVGSFGKDISKLYEDYKKQGLNVKMKIYNNMRHEILNELNKVIVYNDVINFINENKNSR